MLGNITNVSILGLIGIVVPFNPEELGKCNRIKKYINFATTVGKISKIFQNVIIINKEKFLNVLEKYQSEIEIKLNGNSNRK